MRNPLDYREQMHRSGRIWTLGAVILICCVPLIICVSTGVWPEGGALLQGMLSVCMIYLPIGVIEVCNYSPMLGSGATYLSFVTGNISNLKLPCALNAMQAIGVKPGSEEGELVSTISVAVSSIVTSIIMIIGLLLVLPFKDAIARELKPVMDYVLPAIFGALGVIFISKYWKLAIVPLAVMLLLFLFVVKDNSIRGVMVPVAGALSILAARFMYKKNML